MILSSILAATIVVHIHQTEPRQVLGVDLVRIKSHGRVPGEIAGHVSLEPTDGMTRDARFENVDAGPYAVIARGAEPWERAGERVVVDVGDPSPVHIQIAPFAIRLRTTRRGQPLESRVILRNGDGLWEAMVPLDDGHSDITLWQGGRLNATVESRGNVPYHAQRSIVEATTWDLEMPRFELTGRVIDAETHAPISGAAVALEMVSPQRYQLAVSTRADRDGVFKFEPVFPGEHKVKAVAAGYPPAETAFTFSESEETHEVTLTLAKTPMTMLDVRDARGAPVAGADVFVFRGDLSTDFGRTDRNGGRPIFIPENEARDVFIVPLSGSFAVAHVQSGQSDLRLTVPDGSSRIVIRTESDTHDAIERMVVDVRYGGVLLPFEVMAAFAGRGSRTSSGSDGRIVLDRMPPGTYEFRPLAKAAVPVRMTATPGENVAVMTFTRVTN